MAISEGYAWGAVKMLADHAKKPLYWLYLPLGAIGVWQIVKRKQTWWILLVWTACSFLAYTILGVSRYFWYYVPLAPGVLVPVAVGAGWIYRKLSTMRQPAVWQAGRVQWAWTVVLVALLLVPNLRGLVYISSHPDVRRPVYSRAGQWIDAHLPAYKRRKAGTAVGVGTDRLQADGLRTRCGGGGLATDLVADGDGATRAGVDKSQRGIDKIEFWIIGRNGAAAGLAHT